MKYAQFRFAVLCIFVITNVTTGQWIRTSGPPGGVIEGLAVCGGYLIAGAYGGLFTSSDNGEIWTKNSVGLFNTNVNALAVSDSNLFAATFGGVYRSTNNGATWISTGLSYNNIVQALAVRGTVLLAGTRAGAYLSADKGVSWSPVNTGLTNSTITAVAISGTIFFVGSDSGVSRSTNNGANWNVVNTGLSNIKINSLLVYGDYIVAGAVGGIYISFNNGTSWNQVYNSFGNGSVHALVATGTTLFAGTAGNGVFRASDVEKRWVNMEMPDSMVFSLAVHGNYLFAGTGNSVWRRPLSEMITSASGLRTTISAQYSLVQNYPNPFNPRTTISFSLPSRSVVSLKVFDVIGREIATLVSDEELVAGTYSRQWNAGTISSGIYYYRLQAGSFTETKQLVLVR